MGRFIAIVLTFCFLSKLYKKISNFGGKTVDEYYQNMIKLFKKIHKNTWLMAV